MAVIDIWIQIENHAWDTVPHRFDRMEGMDFNPTSVLVSLTSPVTGATRNNIRMYRPVMDGGIPGGALILRRYTPNWAAPADRKVNPWDLNEPDPTDTGTMGTIPGPGDNWRSYVDFPRSTYNCLNHDKKVLVLGQPKQVRCVP